ncbi:MAG TPA: thioesterase family protein [Thermoanaerobaculia bacterium]|jgi:acyl-CoA thioesterase FadM
MLLLFRFLLTVATARFRARVGPLESSTVRFTAMPWDCDLNFHLNAGRYVSFMDIARIELLARMRILRRVLQRGWRPVVGGGTITYRRSVQPFERFRIQSRIVAWDEKWFYIEHVVSRADGSHAATGVMRTLVRDKKGGVPTRDVLEVMGLAHMESPLSPSELPRQ